MLKGLFVLFAIIILAACALLFLRFRKRKPPAIDEPIFSAPDDLPPAAAGALVADRVDCKDLVATLVDLARRGYLRISGDLSLTRLRSPDENLRPFETHLLNTLFKSQDELDIFELMKRVKKAASGFSRKVMQEQVRRGYRLPVNLIYVLPILGLLPVIYTGFLPRFFGSSYSYNSDIFGLLLIGVPVLAPIFLSVFVTDITPAGLEAAGRWVKFKDYQDRSGKYADQEPSPTEFDVYLPYAIAFNYHRMWIEAFARIELITPGWYRSAEISEWQKSIRADVPPSGSAIAPGTETVTGAQAMETPPLTAFPEFASQLTSMIDELSTSVEIAWPSSTLEGPG